MFAPGTLAFAATLPTDTSMAGAASAMPAEPSISNVTVTDITDTSARIDIDSDEVVQGYVEYGTTEQYGMSTPLSSEFSTSPSFLLENLSPETLYHYRVIVMDSAGNAAITTDKTFTTLATPVPKPSSTPAPTPSLTPTPTPTPSPSIDSGPSATPTATPTPTLQTPTPSTIVVSPTPLATSTPLVISKPTPQAEAPSLSGGGGLPVAPTHPLLLKVTPLDGAVSFEWRKDRGVKNGTIHTLIVKKAGADPVKSRADGEIIYNGPSTKFTDTNVENDKEYHYALYSYGVYGRFTVATHFKIVPQAGKKEIGLPTAEANENAAPVPFASNLFYGIRGNEVARLQKYLAANGYYPEALTTGYFGSLTRAAVIRFQKLNNIAPAVGYVGPITRDALVN